MSLSYALGQRSITRTKNFLTRARPSPNSTITHSSAGTRSPRGLIPRTGLWWRMQTWKVQ